MTTTDFSLPLSEILHKGTLESHKEVENSVGANALVQGELSKDEYARFLMMLWHIYDAFEQALDRHASHPTLQHTYNPTLFSRRAGLAADISYILQVPESTWQSHPIHLGLTSSPPTALTDYTSRIKALDSADPSPLLAHSYVRYLGDLSGGQLIKHRLAKAYSLDEQVGSGLSFYSFKQLGSSNQATSQGDMRKIKAWFKAGMDAGAGDSAELKEAILREANIAFDLNSGLFNSLRTTLPTSNGSAEEVTMSKEIPVVVEQDAEREKTYSLATVASFITAVCLAHFLLVVCGFTGDRGYAKLLAFEQWVASVWRANSD